MALLVSGLLSFLTVHLIPSSPRLRQFIVATLTLIVYKMLFHLLSLISMVMIIIGLMEAEFIALYEPPSWGYTAAMVLMFPAIYLFLSNSVLHFTPSSIPSITANSLNWGAFLWAVAHLISMVILPMYYSLVR